MESITVALSLCKESIAKSITIFYKKHFLSGLCSYFHIESIDPYGYLTFFCTFSYLL